MELNNDTMNYKDKFIVEVRALREKMVSLRQLVEIEVKLTYLGRGCNKIAHGRDMSNYFNLN